jgi:hypothetical protein
MKISEFIYDEHTMLCEVIDRIFAVTVKQDDKPVRIEFHSLDAPWPTEKPEGWGVGWWCEYEEFRYLCVQITSSGGCVLMRWKSDGSRYYRDVIVDQITAFGPRAEVPRC